MPWTTDNPPSCAKNWTDAEKAKCVKTANAVLRDGGSEQDAIFACIRAAGKTKHPGGQDAQGADELGRMGGPEAGGPGGQCVCPKCGYKAPHDTGEPCYEMTCPKCGAKMTRQAVQGSLALEPVTAEDLEEYSNHTLLADYKPKELLKFKGAHLCSAGTNKNNDWIDEKGIEELASTMHFLAIDDEHDEQKVIGFFVHPRAAGPRLITDGVIYARRFPKIAKQIQNGEKKLSVEAIAQTAICSVCAGEYTSYKDYCEHLLHRQKFAAQRKLFGLRAQGGATVKDPAWDTSFDANGFMMIASQMEFEPKEDDATLSLWAKLENKLDAYFQKLKPMLTKVKVKGGGNVSESTILEGESLEELKERLGLVEATEVETVRAELVAKDAELKAEVEKTKLGFERATEMGLGAEAAPILGDLNEQAYELFKAQNADPEATVEAGADPAADPGEGDPPGQTIEAGEDPDPQAIQAGELQGAVLGDGVVAGEPLSWAGYPKLFAK